MRKFILLSVILPGMFLLSTWLFARFYEAPNVSGELSFIAQNFSLQSIDETQLEGTYTRLSPSDQRPPSSSHKSSALWSAPLVVFIADLNLDRDWNAPHASFHSGRWLAESLGSFGIESVRYDHRGTGRSRSSKKTKHDFNLKAEDLRTIYAYARKQKPQKLFFLAHGNNACALLLYALQKWKFLQEEEEGIFLLSCGAEGDLLELWARKVFFNMQRKGASAASIAIAQKEWQLWKDSHIRSSVKNKGKAKQAAQNAKKEERAESPDLAAFRTALRFLSSDEMQSFRNRAPQIRFFSLLEKQIRKGKAILHIKCRYDEENPPEDQQSISSFAKQIQKKYNTSYSYRFLSLNNCNHFLKEESRIAQGFVLSLSRANPLISLAPQIPQEIKTQILNTDGL